jgi:hypothetical protein
MTRMGNGNSTPTLNPAERGRFELPVPCGTPVFETGAFDHSATSPGLTHAPIAFVS